MKIKRSSSYVKGIAAVMFAYSLSPIVQADALYETSFQTKDPLILSRSFSADGHLEQWLQEIEYLHPDQFRLQKVKESLTARHYQYQQYEQDLPVSDSTVTISISKIDGTLMKSHSHIVDTIGIKTSQADFDMSVDDALDIAWRNLRVNGKLRATPSIEKVWLPTQSGLVATYRVAISVSAPRGDWVQYIDSNNGNVVKLEQKAVFEKNLPQESDLKPNHFIHIDESLTRPLDEALNEINQKSSLLQESAITDTGTGRVFDPDPKTTLNNDDLTDSAAAEQFEGSYFTYSLPEVTVIDGMYHLKSSWVEIADLEAPSVAPAVSADGNWLFNRGQDGFDDTNVFYHIDSNQRYIQSLGFTGDTGIQFGVMRVDSNGWNGGDNSSFSRFSNTLSFGHGGVNDSEDADVILHEYGHAINHDINDNFSGPDAGGMGEGFGDYWAGSYSISTSNGDTFFPNRVFTWDGHNEFWAGRILNDLAARYNPARSYPAHAIIDGVLSDQLWSTPLFQSLLQLIDMGYTREEVDTIILEAQFGLGGGLTMPIMAESIVQAAARLYPQGPHSRVFFQNFINHNILSSGLSFDPAIRVKTGGSDIVEPGETARIKIAMVSSTAPATDVSAEISVPEGFPLVRGYSVYHDLEPGVPSDNCHNFIVDIPTDTVCGTQIEVKATYQATVNDFAFSGTDTFNIVVGDIATDSMLQDTALPVPDNGPEVISSLNLVEADEIVRNLKVRVNIEHTFIGDLIVGIESPQGTRVLLHTRSGGSLDDLQVTYPDDVEPTDSLDILNGEPLSGEWKLFIQDNAGLDIGQVVDWELIFEREPVCKINH